MRVPFCIRLSPHRACRRTKEREILKPHLASSLETEAELAAVLRRFSARAVGRGQTSDEDIIALRNHVWKLQSSAQRLEVQVPAVMPEFDRYADALVRLQKSAERLNRPLDRKRFVESEGTYLATQQDFISKVSAARSNWL